MNILLNRSHWVSFFCFFHSPLTAELPTHDFLANITVAHVEISAFIWKKKLILNSRICGRRLENMRHYNPKAKNQMKGALNLQELSRFPSPPHNFRVLRFGVLLCFFVIWNWHHFNCGKMNQVVSQGSNQFLGFHSHIY